ncbi:MAG: VCBS repeat-containing protein [Planctomycetota bacterium]
MLRPHPIHLAVLCATGLFAAAAEAQITYRSTSGSFDFGAGIDAVPDINGDGVPDLVIATPGASPQGIQRAGVVGYYSGLDGAPLGEVRGTRTFASIGHEICVLPDVDGDGWADFAFSEDGAVGISASVHVHSGRSLALIRTHAVASLRVASLEPSPDVDGDGIGDYLVGALDGSVSHRGRVRLFSGATGAVLLNLNHLTNDASFGWRVAALGDVNGDGTGDIAVTSSSFSSTSPSVTAAGRVEVISGSTGQALWARTGTSIGEQVGLSMRAMADLDGDGVMDLIVTSVTELFAVSGRTGTVIYTRPLVAVPNLTSHGYENDLEVLGDVDFDGVPELLVHSRTYELGNELMTLAVSALVLRGASGETLAALPNPGRFDLPFRAGGWHGGADFDGDGRADLIAAVSGSRVEWIGFPLDAPVCAGLANSTGQPGAIDSRACSARPRRRPCSSQAGFPAARRPLPRSGHIRPSEPRRR